MPLKNIMNMSAKNSLIWRLLQESLKSQWAFYVVAIVAMVFVAISSSGIAWIMRDVIDFMSDANNRSRVFLVAAGVFVIFLIRGVATYVQVVALSRAGNRIVAQQQNELYEKLLRQGVAFFNLTESSDLLMQVTYS